MGNFYMKIFRFFNKIADYFWKKALQTKKKEIDMPYHKGSHSKGMKKKKKMKKGKKKKINGFS